jgi:hypothetical protein
MIDEKPKKKITFQKTQKELERRKVVIGYSNRGGVKYSKTTFALVYQGYDMLENLIVSSIQRRYDIDISL